MKIVRICMLILILALFGVWILPVGCGGGGGGGGGGSTPPQSCSQLVPDISTTPPAQTIVTSGANVQTITVDGGPLGDYPNAAFATVTVCIPGSDPTITSNCQTIDHVLVDTGASGLRLLSSVLALSLTTETTGGHQIGECVQFGDLSYVWGPVQTADVYLANGNEIALSVPIHVLDHNFSTIPTSCSTGFTEADNLSSLGAKGILGVGSAQYDSGTYYTCTSSVCTSALVSLPQQVQNPVALFSSTDKNGVIIELPFVSGPTASLTGSMVFGIDTKGNNSSSGTTKFYLDSNGNISTTFNNKSKPSFIDSGSNGYFFPDTAITQCTGRNQGWYCPPSKTLLNFTATNNDSVSDSNTVSFSVGNAADMFNYCQNDYVLNTLAGPFGSPPHFDWGLPFFYGRNVYTSITPDGNGSYWAF